MSNGSHFVEAKVLCKRTPHGVAVTLVSGDKPFSFVLTQAAATQALCGLMAALDEEWDVDNVVCRWNKGLPLTLSRCAIAS